MTLPPNDAVVSLDEVPVEAIETYVSDHRNTLIDLARSLVRCASTLGSEEAAQQVVAEFLGRNGFETERIEPDANAAREDATAGYPFLPYAGRFSVAGTRRGAGGGSSLHLSGHVDVVPVDPLEGWTHDPWEGEVADGRLWGRGAGDMKGGLAAYLVAAAAVAELCDASRGDLLVSSVIEEECGGNGMWAVLRAGHEGDATLIGESTALSLGHAGTGVVWARLVARGKAGHSAYGGRDGPFDELSRAVGALRVLEAEANNDIKDELFASASDWPYSVSVGRIEGGVWTASTPTKLVAHVRFGFGRDKTAAGVQAMIRDAVAAAAPRVDAQFEAFRANAYCHPIDGPLPDLMRVAHQRVTGGTPKATVFTATTDARQVAGPCLCYGPVAGNLHAADEWVDVASLEQTAAVVAVAAARWLA